MNNNHTGRIILVILISLVLLAGAFSGGVILGWLIPSGSPVETLAPVVTTAPEIISPTQPSELPSTPAELEELFKPFWESWNIVHDQYVDQPVDDLLLMRGAIRGMIEALGDIHSGYMTPEDYQQASTPLDGSYTGIGAWVDTSGEYLTIISPMPDSPAEAAGIKTGDQIIAVDGESVIGKDPNIVLQSVLGPEGTTVVLTIQRSDPEETLDFTITRARITIPSIESRMLDSNIAYIALFQFGEESSADLEQALEELLASNPAGLILDLRDNGGGYVDTAIEVISQFIGSGVVMIERFGDGEEVTLEAIPGGLATEIPLVVLVNNGSASASEITAGAIQDYQRGKIVGTTTYGKGSVQNWIPLEDDQGAVKVTIARWLTPNGRLIHEIGLTPDYIVEITDEDIEAGRDPQLDKAVELLLNIEN
ncbi:MAG TPA: S41 family peptidase [Anaerolineaceae bacterium]|nr:S41 family peptidase [Anaerolineaceae bacterium]